MERPVAGGSKPVEHGRIKDKSTKTRAVHFVKLHAAQYTSSSKLGKRIIASGNKLRTSADAELMIFIEHFIQHTIQFRVLPL